MSASGPRSAGIRCIGLAALLLVALAGCGEKNSYAAVEAGLRAWLTAVDTADPAACDLETPSFHDALMEQHPELGGAGTSCADRVKRMSTLNLPAPDASMTVGAWDPAGEASVDVTEGGDVRSFWMAYEDDRWVVAGEAS